MRTITITKNIYSFNELSDKAKETVLERFRTEELSSPWWQSENADTVKAIADKFNWEYNIYSYDGITYSIGYSLNDEDAANLSGKRAMAYIQNNFIDACKKPKTYWLNNSIYCDGRKNWKRESKINFTIDDCPFTGYWLDFCFAEAWKIWKQTFCEKSTVRNFLYTVATRLGEEWTSDNEYLFSDEGIAEMIEANDYEFYEDGTVV